MPISAEELIKIEKDKDLDIRYKSVKQAIRLNVTRYITEANNGNILRYIGTYACDTTNLKEGSFNVADRSKSVLYSLTILGNMLDTVFDDVGDAKEGILAHALSTKTTVKLDMLSTQCREIKVNFYPTYVEKYSLGMSDDMEAKMIVPRSTFRAIKTLIDRYYYMFRIISVNSTCRTVFNIISVFRDKVLAFEWNIFHYLKEIQGEYLKESGNFSREIKTSLLNLKKLLEAIDSASFAKLVYVMQDVTRENGLRIFAKHNEAVKIISNDQFKGVEIPLSKLLQVFDEVMKPMRKALSGINQGKKVMAIRSISGNDERIRAYRDIYPFFPSFCEGMKFISNEFGKVMTIRTDEYKFFTHTLDTTIYPYFKMARGEINDLFVTAVKNIDSFFWKLLIMVAERSLEQNITLDEVFGLIIKVTKADFIKYSDDSADTLELDVDDVQIKENTN